MQTAYGSQPTYRSQPAFGSPVPNASTANPYAGMGIYEQINARINDWKKEQEALTMANVQQTPLPPQYSALNLSSTVDEKNDFIELLMSELKKRSKDINKISNLENGGLNSFVEKYAEPSVQKAWEHSKILQNIPISDVNKHQYISCLGAQGGTLSALETLAGGTYKEVKDIKRKINNPTSIQNYGGKWGIWKDSFKDLKNDFKGAVSGYLNTTPDYCNRFLK